MTAFEIDPDLDPIEYARKAGEMARAQAPSVEPQEPAQTLYSNGKTFPGTITEAHAYQERQGQAKHVFAFPGKPEPANLPQLTRDDLLEMSPAEINEAHANGQFSQMLGLI
ncbi:hypothetical protein [Streptomyces albus]|uniref:hypothetical protein n=1 Tax=Streptomyces sp. NRRL F-5639 TaxID=1463867 RepID=UPI0004CAC62D|nr:hypothetical protein [Streptomyces sp. NRRL F-5639]